MWYVQHHCGLKKFHLVTHFLYNTYHQSTDPFTNYILLRLYQVADLAITWVLLVYPPMTGDISYHINSQQTWIDHRRRVIEALPTVCPCLCIIVICFSLLMPPTPILFRVTFLALKQSWIRRKVKEMQLTKLLWAKWPPSWHTTFWNAFLQLGSFVFWFEFH